MHPCPDCLGDPQHQPCPTCGLGSELDEIEVWYEPCRFGCCNGTVYAAGGVEWECPVCAGGGVGEPHLHEEIRIVVSREATDEERDYFT